MVITGLTRNQLNGLYRSEGSNPSLSAILVEQNRCPPFKARSCGLFWHFRDEKFQVKTVDAFQVFLQGRRI